MKYTRNIYIFHKWPKKNHLAFAINLSGKSLLNFVWLWFFISITGELTSASSKTKTEIILRSNTLKLEKKLKINFINKFQVVFFLSYFQTPIQNFSRFAYNNVIC